MGEVGCLIETIELRTESGTLVKFRYLRLREC